jgi:chlorobactene glucosyltransferase
LIEIVFIVSSAVLLFQIYFWINRARELIEGSLGGIPEIDPRKIAELPESPPLISVIVPAHNEEMTIEDCLSSVLAQDYPNYELILVDDRSQDRTAAIAEELARNKKPFKIVRVAELPAGWTGKCHALDRGVVHANGEWVAFLDADSTLHTSALRQCYAEAVKAGVNMITLTPKFILKSFWEKALQPTFAAMSCILFPITQINAPSSPVASANGMFYLISRPAYDAIDGHRDVRNLAVEDIGIGKRVKASGLGLLFANGRRVLQTRMYTNFHEIINGWARILSASMNYRVSTALKYLCIHMLMSLPVLVLCLYTYVPTAQSLWPNTWFVAPLVLSTLAIMVSALYCKQIGAPVSLFRWVFLGNILLIWVFLVIVKRILMKDALQWRGTTYQTSKYQPTCLNPVNSRIYTGTPTSVLKEIN